jgi:hypothetical protein
VMNCAASCWTWCSSLGVTTGNPRPDTLSLPQRRRQVLRAGPAPLCVAQMWHGKVLVAPACFTFPDCCRRGGASENV